MATPNPNIKAIVFDFNGVIQFSGLTDLLADIADTIHVPIADFRKRYFELNHLSNVDNLPWEQMILRVIETFTDSADLHFKALEIVANSQSDKKPNQELITVIPKLKALGYKIAIFSNHTSELRAELKRMNIDSLFDEVVISGEIGFQKPNGKAFEVLFTKLGVLPSEVIYIDDTSRSLEGAEEIGYTPILFQGNASLMDDLRKLGIIIE